MNKKTKIEKVGSINRLGLWLCCCDVAMFRERLRRKNAKSVVTAIRFTAEKTVES
jgi:uncharacterized protein YjhX (UPF0386 family)